MRGLNKVLVIGRLGGNPELRYTNNGTPVCNFNIATNESWNNKEGQREERTEWHRIVVWGKLAELCGQYLSKGRLAYIEGRLQTRSWEDQDGKKRYTTEIVAQNVQFLDSGASAEQGPQNFPDAPAMAAGGPPSGGSDISDDDIPF